MTTYIFSIDKRDVEKRVKWLHRSYYALRRKKTNSTRREIKKPFLGSTVFLCQNNIVLPDDGLKKSPSFLFDTESAEGMLDSNVLVQRRLKGGSCHELYN